MANENPGQSEHVQDDTTPLEPSASKTPADNQPQNQPPAGAKPGAAADTVPSYRLREVTERYRTLETDTARKIAQFEAQLEAERRKVAALSGVTPQDPKAKELEEARKVLETMYPGLSRLTDKEIFSKLDQVLDMVPRIQASQEQHWASQGTRTLKELDALAVKELGGDLNPKGRRALQTAFIDYVQSDEEAGGRYLQGDPEVVKDFWEFYRSTFIDPARRAAASSMMSRQNGLRQPRGGTQSPNAPAPKKPNFQDEDEVHGAAWEAIAKRFGQ